MNKDININFCIEPKKDIVVCMHMADMDYKSRAGFNIFRMLIKGLPKELEKCPKLKKEERLKLVTEVVNKEHQKGKKVMQEKKEEYEKEFSKIKDEFLEISSKLFDNHQWPKGDYSVILTIWSIYPRDVQTKAVYIPFKREKDKAIQVLIHELLHILFYNYWEKNFKDRLSKELTWDFSEIINIILQDLPELKKYYDIESEAYPEHKERYNHLKEIYPKCNSMKEFFEKAIKYLKEQGDKGPKLNWDDKTID